MGVWAIRGERGFKRLEPLVGQGGSVNLFVGAEGEELG